MSREVQSLKRQLNEIQDKQDKILDFLKVLSRNLDPVTKNQLQEKYRTHDIGSVLPYSSHHSSNLNESHLDNTSNLDNETSSFDSESSNDSHLGREIPNYLRNSNYRNN